MAIIVVAVSLFLVLLKFANAQDGLAYIYQANTMPANTRFRNIGWLVLRQSGRSVIVEGTLRSLPPGFHGFHIHQFGTLANGCLASGGHYNPSNQNHGGPTSAVRHAGDLGNLNVQANGIVFARVTDSVISLAGMNAVMGRTIVVHANRDDLGLGGDMGSLTTGNAGGRIACGIIEPAAPVCVGTSLTVEARNNVVAFHNILRSSIAIGRSRPGPTQASNMQRLSYSCGLELLAQTVAERCLATTSAPNTRPGRGENYLRYTGRSAAPQAMLEAMTVWWDQVRTGWNGGANNIFTAQMATRLSSYAQMAWGATTQVGCGMANCAGFRSIVCQYIQRGAIVGQPMVQPGAACRTNADCNAVAGTTCNVPLGICEVPPNPGPVTSTASPGGGGMCTAAPLLTDAIRTNILMTHNTLRGNIARGMLIGPAMNVFTKGCQDMFTIRYNCALEGTAQGLADQCGLAAAYPLMRGRNVNAVVLAAAPANPPTAAQSVTDAMTAWIAQSAMFNANAALAAGAANPLAMVGHFAQMAFSRTTEIGCGYAQCTALHTVVACVYSRARGDTGRVYQAVTANGCLAARCNAAVNRATCNTTTALCQSP